MICHTQRGLNGPNTGKNDDNHNSVDDDDDTEDEQYEEEEDKYNTVQHYRLTCWSLYVNTDSYLP